MVDCIPGLQSRTRRPRRRAVRNRAARSLFRPTLEGLEDRRLLTILWDSPTGGNWDDPGNWWDPVLMGHRLPNAFDDVSFSLPGETLTVVTGGLCADFSLGASSHFVVNGNLTINGAADVDGSVAISGANARMALDDVEPSSFDGPLTWDDGILVGGAAGNYVEVNDTMT